jgi:hypothetical protein
LFAQLFVQRSQLRQSGLMYGDAPPLGRSGRKAQTAKHGHRLPIGLKLKRSRLGAIHQQRQEAQQIA